MLFAIYEKNKWYTKEEFHEAHVEHSIKTL